MEKTTRHEERFVLIGHGFLNHLLRRERNKRGWCPQRGAGGHQYLGKTKLKKVDTPENLIPEKAHRHR